MVDNFDKAVGLVLFFEGGYVNDKEDDGGETNFGISSVHNSDVNVKGLTRDKAIEIYKDRYWFASAAHKLPVGVNTAVFDTAVNAGPSRAKKLLQRALRVKEDGLIGPKTIAAIEKMNRKELVISFTTERILYYTSLDDFKHFGRGWVNRANNCLLACITEIEES